MTIDKLTPRQRRCAELAARGIQLQAELTTQFQHRAKSTKQYVRIRSMAEQVVDPDKQLSARQRRPEDCVHCMLENKHRVNMTLWKTIRSKDAHRGGHRLTFDVSSDGNLLNPLKAARVKKTPDPERYSPNDSKCGMGYETRFI